MEQQLLVGSSLAAQIDVWGPEWSVYSYRGKINLYRLAQDLRYRRKSYKRITIVAGNDIIPSKKHVGQYGFHHCLDVYNERETMEKFQSLYSILAFYTKEILIVQPPPRCQPTYNHQTTCLAYSVSVHRRFRDLINSIQRSKRTILGVVSCDVYAPRYAPLTADDGIHFSHTSARNVSRFLSR